MSAPVGKTWFARVRYEDIGEWTPQFASFRELRRHLDETEPDGVRYYPRSRSEGAGERRYGEHYLPPRSLLTRERAAIAEAERDGGHFRPLGTIVSGGRLWYSSGGAFVVRSASTRRTGRETEKLIPFSDGGADAAVFRPRKAYGPDGSYLVVASAACHYFRARYVAAVELAHRRKILWRIVDGMTLVGGATMPVLQAFDQRGDVVGIVAPTRCDASQWRQPGAAADAEVQP